MDRQWELMKRLHDFDNFIAERWLDYSEVMRDCVLLSRRRIIKDLQKQQLKEFDR